MKRLNIQTNPELGRLHGVIVLTEITKHARWRGAEKGATIPGGIHVEPGDVVELECEQDTVTKLVIRKSGADRWNFDTVYVVKRIRGGWALITLWLNRTDDNHDTLRLDRLG